LVGFIRKEANSLRINAVFEILQSLITGNLEGAGDAHFEGVRAQVSQTI
jgi:hypothetical protein